MAITFVNGKQLYFPQFGDIVKHPVTGVEGYVKTTSVDRLTEVKVEYLDGHYEYHKTYELKPYLLRYGHDGKLFTVEEYLKYLEE